MIGALDGAPDPELAHALLLGPVFAWLHLLRRAPTDLADRLAERVAAALAPPATKARR